MSRAKKWPEKVTLTLLDCGTEQAADVEKARHLILVESPNGPRPMDKSEIAREGLHYLVGKLKAGRYRRPRKPRPGEAKIVEVGKWDGD